MERNSATQAVSYAWNKSRELAKKKNLKKIKFRAKNLYYRRETDAASDAVKFVATPECERATIRL